MTRLLCTCARDRMQLRIMLCDGIGIMLVVKAFMGIARVWFGGRSSTGVRNRLFLFVHITLKTLFQ
jgi:hypothetical protein